MLAHTDDGIVTQGIRSIAGRQIPGRVESFPSVRVAGAEVPGAV